MSPEFCCTDSKTFELLKHIQREIQGYAPFVLPLVLLLGFGVVFAAASLGGSMLGFDDHPGQLYRVWHVMTYGPAPWAWDRGWWAGYPELQFYPPGFAYLGALLAWPTTGVLEIATVYQALLWLAYLLPGVTTYVVLARLTGSGWSALPAAFVALTLSAGLASGVDGGVRTGMVGARLAWALLPLLLWLLARWTDDDGALSPAVAPLLAVITLLHPAQLPAAVVLVALAAYARAPWRARTREALRALAFAAALTAFWTLPLLFRLAETRALAWGTFSTAQIARPLPVVLAALAVAGLLDRTPARGERLALWWLPAAAVVTALDHLAVERLGIRWLPADRVVDGAWIALVVGGGVGLARLARRLDALPFSERLALSLRGPALGLGATVVFALLSLGGTTLMLRPGAAVWPSLSSIDRGLRLPDFWSLLGRLPEGRLLFVRSGVPLVYGGNWWRPHSHVTALTPVGSGRDIVHGTFTHPSPIAALVYRGDAGRGPITQLAEQLDGRTLFGEKLEALDPARFSTQADRLGVVAVVALEDDETQLGWLAESTAFRRRLSLAPFVVFARESAVALPTARDGAWRMTLAGEAGAWTSARVAYYPLWRVEADGAPVPTRRGADGLLEVRLTRVLQTLTLRYAPGVPEIAGVALSAIAAGAWVVFAWRSG